MSVENLEIKPARTYRKRCEPLARPSDAGPHSDQACCACGIVFSTAPVPDSLRIVTIKGAIRFQPIPL